jgi:hypothetical protein
VFEGNTVRRADHGFSEQQGGWGNQWVGNLAEDNRKNGFVIRTQNMFASSPDPETPAYLQVRCNRAVGNRTGLTIGWVQQSTFETNAFPSVRLGPALRDMWGDLGNTWDGSSTPPPSNPPQITC